MRYLSVHRDAHMRSIPQSVVRQIDLASVSVRAERLSAKCRAEVGCRSLDLWHVAAALEAGRETFVSYDLRQRQVAESISL